MLLLLLIGWKAMRGMVDGRVGIRAGIGRRGQIFASLLFELSEIVTIEVSHDRIVTVNLGSRQLIHESSKAGIGADRDERKSFRLTIHFVLIELDVDEIGHLK